MFINFALEAAIVSMIIAQLLKLPILYFFENKWSPSIVFSTGGMPSSHSAFVTALMIGIALTEGIASPYFAISFVLAGVVIHDSIGIRREAGKHASVLNKMRVEIEELVLEFQKGKQKDPSKIDSTLKELLGHEPIEAISGVLLGTVVTFVMFYFWIVL